MDATISVKPSCSDANGNPEETLERHVGINNLVIYFIIMIYHHTKNKGDLGVLKVKLDLLFRSKAIQQVCMFKGKNIFE